MMQEYYLPGPPVLPRLTLETLRHTWATYWEVLRGTKVTSPASYRGTCTFCREAAERKRKEREALEAANSRIRLANGEEYEVRHLELQP